MKSKIFSVFMMLFLMLLCRAGVYLANAESPALPNVYFPEETYEFPPVIEGDAVQHDFVLINKGIAPVDIIEVKTA
jgi:hypothetical protein